MTTSMEAVIKATGEEAELLTAEIREDGDLAAAFRALEQRVVEFEQSSGKDASALLPADDDAGLRFLRNRHGEDFWRAYRKRLQKELCSSHGNLRKMFRKGSSFAGPAVVTTIVTTLQLPVAIIPLFGPIVAILMSIGLDAFCDATADTENGTD